MSAIWRIIVRDQAGAVVGQYELDESMGSIVVGRGADAHLLLDDPSISREHAFFYITEGELVVEDAGSTLGTDLDGYPIEEPCYVGPENHLRIGPFDIEVAPEGLDAASVAVDSDFVGEAAAAGAPAVIDEEDYREPYDPTLKPQGGFLKLVAISGLDAGKEQPLNFPEDFDVGRDEELEIPVLDPTVSRRHARLRQTDQGVLVIDLRSLNGTYVNGAKIKRQEAQKGDRLRFGEVAYELQAATAKDLQPAAAVQTKFTRKHMILVGGGSIFVIALLVLGLTTGKKPAPKRRAKQARTTTVDSKLQRQFRQRLGEARLLMAKRKWQQAKDMLLKTQDIFARHDTRDGLLSLVNEEMHHQVILKQANDLFIAGTNLENFQKARQQYSLIKPESDYFGEARLKLEKVNLWLAGYYLTEGLTYAESWRQDNRIKAAQYMCQYFTLLPEYHRAGGSEDKHRQILTRLEKRLRRVKKYDKCQAKRFLTREVVGGATTKADPLAELRRQHQLEPLVQIMMLYYQGNLDASINRLQKLQGQRSMRKHRIMLGAVFNKLTFIKGKYSEGTSALQSGQLIASQAAFDQALAKDAELVPPTLRSYVMNESGRLLAERYVELGQREYKRSRYVDAYMYWHKGKLANPTHVEVLNALLKLEAVARNFVAAAASLANAKKTDEARAKYEQVRQITEPGSRYYTQATRALANLK